MKGIQNAQQIFLYLLAFRWASLLPAAWTLEPPKAGLIPPISPPALLVLAAVYTLLISAGHRSLNRRLLERPALLGLDLLITTALLAASGGASSPYYLYALSPLLAGAFFFQMRGALLSAGAFTPLYLAASLMNRPVGSLEYSREFNQLAGAWLLALLFGYASLLLARLLQAHDELAMASGQLSEQNRELAAAHHQLKIIHDLSLALQTAPDTGAIQRQVLQVVTQDLGYPRAAVGLIDPNTRRLENWLCLPEGASPPASLSSHPVILESGPALQNVLDAGPRWLSPGPDPSPGDNLHAWLGASCWLVLPLVLRDHAVGVLLLSADLPNPELPPGRVELLTSLASQAALTLGTTLLCIDRARRLAIEQERNRIARDIHDTVSQSLFGIVFSLDACVKMLPEQADQVRRELIELQSLASLVRDEVRHSILDLWQSDLSLETFKSDLLIHTAQCCRQQAFQVEFNNRGDFERLPPVVRRTLYRVAQEALANAAKHAGAQSAVVSLAVDKDQVLLSVADQGNGFDPQAALRREYSREHFGLRGMQERVHALGGSCQFNSRPGAGAEVAVSIPLFERSSSG